MGTMQADIEKSKLRIAAFGIRTLPPARGAAGGDTVANELYTRLAARGHDVTVYCRAYKADGLPRYAESQGVRLVHIKTVSRSGFDTLVHSFLSTMHILRHNTGDVVHIHNGGNSIWALPLRLAGKRVYVSQDGLDWERKKWKWYARLYLRLSMYLTSCLPTIAIFDNIFTREVFEEKFHRKFLFVPYGSDFTEPTSLSSLERHGLAPQEYFLFVGRFIPEKGIHYLVEAFEGMRTDKQLVIVGGSPNPNSEYEKKILTTTDKRIHFLGYVYGDEMLELMKGCYCYVQPSDVEGLSPVILTAMGMGTPVICSDIRENVYAVGNTAMLFRSGDVESLRLQLEWALGHPDSLPELGKMEQQRARRLFSWDSVVETYERVFTMSSAEEDVNRAGAPGDSIA